MIFGSVNLILIASAVIPAVILLKYVYKMDIVEKESPRLLRSLIWAGILSTLLAVVTETIGEYLLAYIYNSTYMSDTLYNAITYFIVVGLSEEGFKYMMLKRKTWNIPDFDCQFDGVVYAVYVSLGFAIWENIKYVLSYGFTTALIRAITAVPGHACFGVFMGTYYGLAKRWDYLGYKNKSKSCRRLAVIVPVIVHGAYDFIASMENNYSTIIFIAFVGIMFLICFRMIKKLSKEDRYIDFAYTDTNQY